MENECVSAVKIGEKIPEIEIDAYIPTKKDFDKINLSSLAKDGKWTILFFYPADYTFVCPTELADIQDIYKDLQSEGAELISMSTDTQFVHLAWQSSERILQDLTYPMGADPTHKVSKLLGVYDESTGLALRGTFIIDPAGTLVASEVNFYSVGRNSEELLRKFKAFKYVSQNPSNVCPARWKPGQKTLAPGANIIGKIGEALD